MNRKIDISRRGFVALGGSALAVLAGLGLAGCGGDAGSGSAAVKDTASGTEFKTHTEDRELKGSADATAVRVGLIMGPPSMGLSQFLLAAKNGKTFNDFSFELNGVDYVGLSAKFNQGDYDICTLPSNIGPILFNNDELKNDYQVISIDNLGVLYVITTDSSIKTLDDLKGKSVLAYGQGGTPEYTIDALLKKNGHAGDFTVEFKSTPFEILNLIQDQEGAIAILPQPFVALAATMVDKLYVPISITDEWNRAFKKEGSMAVTTTTIVNKKFCEEHEQAVVEYLQMAGKSVDWSLRNMKEASQLQEELGTFLNNQVSLAAMPHIEMVNITGERMRTALSGFVKCLYEANPDSVGGEIPGDDFYYLPPQGYLDESVTSVSGEDVATGGSASEGLS